MLVMKTIPQNTIFFIFIMILALSTFAVEIVGVIMTNIQDSVDNVRASRRKT